MEPPIFLLGSPRSGTTITLQLLAAHEELGWISQHQHVRPEMTAVSILNRLYDLPGLGNSLYTEVTQDQRFLPEGIRYYLPEPVEPWGFWENFLKHFTLDRGGAEPPRRRTAEDVSEHEVERIQEAAQAILRAQGKDRFLSKYTDFSRIPYLKEAFPRAVFVHVVRDGRAAAASYHKKIMEGGFVGAWEKRSWWMKAWPEEWQEVWRNEYGDALTFSAFQWGMFVRGIREDAAQLEKKEYLELPYREMTEETQRSLGGILGKVGLGRSRKMEAFIERVNLENRNYKWKDRYSREEKERLTRCIRMCSEINM